MDEIPVPEMAEYDATCHTEGCGNAGYTIRIFATLEAPYIVCGPCSQRIDTVVLVE